MGERISVKDMLCAAMHIGTCNNNRCLLGFLVPDAIN